MMEATENGGNSSYEPLEGRRAFDASDSPEMEGGGPPKDRKKLVFFALMTAGVGFVLPYNSFIIAADYWQSRFPGQSVALDMSMTYIIVALCTVLLNNVFLSLAPFRVRVAFGYAVSFTTLVFVALCEVAWHMFTAKTAYSVNLAAVSLVAMGCTIQQSSFYGFASMLPKQYTQAVMAGESIAGFLVSSNRVVTKLLIKSDRASTAIFFLTSTVYIAFSYVLHSITTHSPFVRYHMKACAKIVLRPDDEHTLSDTIEGELSNARYGVLALESSPPVHIPPGTTTLSFSNPVYELSNPSGGENVLETNINNLTSTTTSVTTNNNTTNRPITTPTSVTASNDVPNVAFKVEHVMTPDICSSGRFGSFRNGLESRWKVAHAIYPYMACIALAYCVTLSLYPGIESEIISCNLGTWMPVLLMFTFNTSDVAGKLLAAVPYSWSRRQLILMSGLRALLVPLILLCCSPREQPVIAGEASAFVFTAALGVTNGLAGSLPMMLAPDKVSATLKEVTGNMMTLSYNIGLTAGSLVGYVFESMLGPQLPNPCPQYPFVPPKPNQPPFNNLSISSTTTTTTVAAAVLTTLSSAILQSSTSTVSPEVSSSISFPVTSVLPQSSTILNAFSTSAELEDTSPLDANNLVTIATKLIYNATQSVFDSTTAR
ncbi:equilibrative nucleoside transporter 4 [Toxorhynchites rutilus septentrionalis]|uniref:equilibrative nucleoside transporter 4 n=1 Tax=Toxorhynchites rutilus septentrionalis TaxID=329112 RepID=UPI00247ADF66|nr:equilibrative nucleoside transporter 4 [Toxorhynchites rutilus septentrionalis]XP_055628182.1 equilibrative nucleoside transporter 4 [Toxorhynchites rutilus septentrionalis]